MRCVLGQLPSLAQSGLSSGPLAAVASAGVSAEFSGQPAPSLCIYWFSLNVPITQASSGHWDRNKSRKAAQPEAGNPIPPQRPEEAPVQSVPDHSGPHTPHGHRYGRAPPMSARTHARIHTDALHHMYTCRHSRVPHTDLLNAHTRSPHSHRLTSHAHMHSRVHTPTADSIHAHTHALNTSCLHIHANSTHTHAYSLGSQTLILKALVGEAVEGGRPRQPPGSSRGERPHGNAGLRLPGLLNF